MSTMVDGVYNSPKDQCQSSAQLSGFQIAFVLGQQDLDTFFMVVQSGMCERGILRNHTSQFDRAELQHSLTQIAQVLE